MEAVWVRFGVRLGLRQTQALIKNKKNRRRREAEEEGSFYSSWSSSVPVSAEGRVEHQKRNQTATSQWPVGFVFGVQLDYSFRLKSVPSDDEKVVDHN